MLLVARGFFTKQSVVKSRCLLPWSLTTPGLMFVVFSFVSPFAYLAFSTQVGTMGKSFYLAGLLGSQALPVPTVKGGNADKPFTIIKNDAALNLAGTQK